LGGGLIHGAVTLIGGEPGIGKSTLLLTMAGKLAALGEGPVLYVSAEESQSQTKHTAERLGAVHPNVHLLSQSDLAVVVNEIERLRPFAFILDSVQTVYAGELSATPGSVSQVREVTARVVSVAKQMGVAAFLVGHVTKDGNIAGPKLLEHMVDTVLYFEATRNGPYRILRAHKNRFGSVSEMGVFEMHANGLVEVPNPSQFFLAERSASSPGSAVAVAVEGTRPVLVEVQALCVTTLFGAPRRTTMGIENTRAALLAAVLERRAGLSFSGQDLFVNVAGGVTLTEPATDLAVALAMASSLLNRPVDSDVACFGEVGLSGEVRSVTRNDMRLSEAQRLGFKRVLLPKGSLKNLKVPEGLELMPVSSVDEAVRRMLQ
jgi:DNA repair protein RadA/Sms